MNLTLIFLTIIFLIFLSLMLLKGYRSIWYYIRLVATSIGIALMVSLYKVPCLMVLHYVDLSYLSFIVAGISAILTLIISNNKYDRKEPSVCYYFFVFVLSIFIYFLIRIFGFYFLPIMFDVVSDAPIFQDYSGITPENLVHAIAFICSMFFSHQTIGVDWQYNMPSMNSNTASYMTNSGGNVSNGNGSNGIGSSSRSASNSQSNNGVAGNAYGLNNTSLDGFGDKFARLKERRARAWRSAALCDSKLKEFKTLSNDTRRSLAHVDRKAPVWESKWYKMQGLMLQLVDNMNELQSLNCEVNNLKRDLCQRHRNNINASKFTGVRYSQLDSGKITSVEKRNNDIWRNSYNNVKYWRSLNKKKGLIE